MDKVKLNGRNNTRTILVPEDTKEPITIKKIKV